MNHKDSFESFMLRVNPPRKYGLKDAAIRPYPRFASLIEFNEGQGFKASIPTVIKTWWIVGLIGIALMWFIFVPVGTGMGFVDGFYDNRGRFSRGYFNPAPLLITIAILVAVSYGILRVIFPRIIIEADRDKITVGKYRYSWDRAEGLRVGYSLGGVEKSAQQGFFWLKFTGLRMAYGQWSHDLPNMVSDYYSVAYVVWINQLLETINIKTDTVNDAAAGIKQQMY